MAQKGKDYEERIRSKLQQHYLAECSSIAGSSHSSDINFVINNVKVGIEIKSSFASECGQKAFKLVDNKLVLPDGFHKNSLGDVVPFGGSIPSFLKSKITLEEWESEKENFKDEYYLSTDPFIVSNYYFGKGADYIHFEDKGLYSTSDDPLNWGVPKLRGDVKIRIRCKQHKGPIPSSVQAVFIIVKSSVPESDYSLTDKNKKIPLSENNRANVDDAEDVEKVIDFQNMTVNELKKYCRDNNIKGYSKCRKAGLIDLVKKCNIIEEKKEYKSPLRYPGGKTRGVKVISEIIDSLFNGRKILLSPFLGGGSLELFYLSRGLTIYGNDLFHPLFIFWKNLKENPDKLCSNISQIINEEEIDKDKFQKLKNFEGLSEIEIASRYYIINRCSFSGATFCGGFSKSAYESRLTQSCFTRMENLAPQLSNIHFSNLDAIDFLKQYDESNDQFIYLDPPYYQETYLYGRDGDLHKNFNHQDLAEYLKTRNDWILSYNDVPKIRELYHFADIQEVNWSLSMTSKKSSEIIIHPRNNTS